MSGLKRSGDGQKNLNQIDAVRQRCFGGAAKGVAFILLGARAADFESDAATCCGDWVARDHRASELGTHGIVSAESELAQDDRFVALAFLLSDFVAPIAAEALI